MTTTPRSTLTVSQAAAVPSAGTDICVIFGAVPDNADGVVRRYSGHSGVLSRHGYSQAIDYAAMHSTETGESFDFVGLPIDVAGTVGQVDTSGNTGSANVSIAVGADGSLDECDVRVRVKSGGIVGTSLILLEVSIDGGRKYSVARVGTATSYTIPYVGLVLSLTAGGTLNTGDTVLTAKSTAPLFSSDDFNAVREKLSERTLQINSLMAVGDSPSLAFAQAAVAELNEFATSNQRFSFVRLAAEDRWSAKMNKQDVVVITDATFDEVGGTGDTITLGGGTWAALGAASGDMLKISGADPGNNKSSYVLPTSITGAVITMNATDLVNESGEDVTFTFSGTLTFNDSNDTATRSKGSFVADGFVEGQTVVITGTASNNFTGVLTDVSATVLTFEAGDVLAAETVAMADVSVTATESIEDHSDRVDLKYTQLDNEFRIALGRGRGFKLSPILGSTMRRPSTWAANIRQYQHDVHIPTWQTAQGALSGWSLRDTDDTLVEYDDRVHGGTASLNKFTSFRSWPNKSAGCFISQDLTRDVDGALLQHVANVATVNKCCTACQSATEDEVGQRVEVDDDGKGTPDALSAVKGRVDGKIDRVVLVNAGEGLPVSGVSWTPDPESILSGTEPVLRGTLDILLNGLIHSVETIAKVR